VVAETGWLTALASWLGGVPAALTSAWFYIPSTVLTFLAGWGVLGLYRSARKTVPAPAPAARCRVTGCPNPPVNLGFCVKHADRPRSCYRLFSNYSEQEHECFFGRGEVVSQLLQAVDGPRLLTLVLGESGVGKSSLLRAGLNPVLKGRTDPAVDPVYVNCRDIAADPISFLEEQLKSLPKKRKVFLELDQFEQVFVRYAARAGALVQWVRDLLSENRRVLISMRRDYADDIDAYQEKLPEVFSNRVRVLRLTRDQAREIMTRSAEYSGVTFPPDLQERILHDLVKAARGRDSGPLISPAELQIICSLLVNGTSNVTLEDYITRKGRAGLLEEFLLNTIDLFPAGDREVARSVLFELARPTVSERVGVAALTDKAPRHERVTAVLGRLDELGFVSRHRPPPAAAAGGDTYELTHDYLIPLIRKFVHETDLDYYKSQAEFDQMQLDYKRGASASLPQLLRVVRHLRPVLRETERQTLWQLVRRWLFRRALPLAGLLVVLLAGLVWLVVGIYRLHYLGPDAVAQGVLELRTPQGAQNAGQVEVQLRTPVVVFRGHPSLPATVSRGWETGYYQDELTEEGRQQLATFPRVGEAGQDFETALEPLLADVRCRATVLFHTQGEGAALAFLRERLTADTPRDERQAALRALSGLGTAHMAEVVGKQLASARERREQSLLLDTLGEFPAGEATPALQNALLSKNIRPTVLLNWLDGLDFASYRKLASVLDELAQASSPAVRGAVRLLQARFGDPPDYAALQSFRDLLRSKDHPLADEDEDRWSPSPLLVQVQLALCTRSLQDCRDAATALLGALTERRRYPSRSRQALVDGLRKALDTPDAARWLFDKALAEQNANSAAVFQILAVTGGRHVADRLLLRLQEQAARAPPEAMLLLRFASGSQLRDRQEHLKALAGDDKSDARSRLYAALALVRVGDPAGEETVRQLLAAPRPGQPRDRAPDDLARLQTAFRKEILYSPESYTRLQATLVDLGSPYVLDRAALGDQTAVAGLAPLLRSFRGDYEEPARAITPAEGDTLYKELPSLCDADSGDLRHAAVIILTNLRDRSRFDLLLKMAKDSRNHTVKDDETLVQKAIAGLRQEKQPTLSIQYLLSVARVNNAETRRAALLKAPEFLPLLGGADESTDKEIRELLTFEFEETRAVAVLLLSERADLATYRRCLKDPSFLVKRLAAQALAKHLKAGAFDLLEDPAWAVRSGAAAGLAEVADDVLMKALREQAQARGGLLHRPLWLVEERYQNRKPPGAPVVQIRFQELTGR
jgi:hypothetical protein